MKLNSSAGIWAKYGSPSMRREWIEIEFFRRYLGKIWVSLHAEGVD